tara:strand:- start:429 stop:1310 length:882 start_codon:yes stop_codon:yes gene_type:complete
VGLKNLKEGLRRLKIYHDSCYRYSESASDSTNLLKLKPKEGEFQQLDFFVISIHPSVRLTHQIDLFGNITHEFSLKTKHDYLEIKACLIATVKTQFDLQNLPYGSGHDSLNNDHLKEIFHHYYGISKFVWIDAEIWKAALDSKNDSDDVFQSSYSIMNWAYENIEYLPGATTVNTTSIQAFHRKAGVCQDFTHIMLAMCRSIGVPARYVSGYFYDSGIKSLRGAAATHAWVEVYIPHLSKWVGLDPTNNKVVDQNYVAIARGRDYGDVTPVSGTFMGGGNKRTLTVSVTVEEY